MKPEQVPISDDDKGGNRLGADIRALRRARQMVLQDMAAALGRSVGWVSQVERGLSDPSIEDLRAIANLFDLPLGFFFRNEQAPLPEQEHVVRRSNRRTIGDRRAGLTEQLLSPDLGGSFEMFRSVFEPGAEMTELNTRPTEEAGYLVSGQLDLWVGDSLFHLGAGDSFRFAGEPYRWRNPGTERAEVIWVISPPVY